MPGTFHAKDLILLKSCMYTQNVWPTYTQRKRIRVLMSGSCKVRKTSIFSEGQNNRQEFFFFFSFSSSLCRGCHSEWTHGNCFMPDVHPDTSFLNLQPQDHNHKTDHQADAAPQKSHTNKSKKSYISMHTSNGRLCISFCCLTRSEGAVH